MKTAGILGGMYPMRLKQNPKIVALLTLCAFLCLAVLPVMGQLILVDFKCRICQVERKNNRLQVSVHDEECKNIQYVEIDANTRFSHAYRIIPYDQAWAAFKPGMWIRVKGGYTMSIHVKAKQIYW